MKMIKMPNGDFFRSDMPVAIHAQGMSQLVIETESGKTICYDCVSMAERDAHIRRLVQELSDKSGWEKAGEVWRPVKTGVVKAATYTWSKTRAFGQWLWSRRPIGAPATEQVHAV